MGLQEFLYSGAGKAVANSDGKEDSKDHLCVFFAVTVVFFFFIFFSEKGIFSAKQLANT